MKYIAFAFMLCLSACTTYKVTEDQVFTPVTAYVPPDDGERVDLMLAWEEVFEGFAPVMIELEVWAKQKASISIPEGELEPVDLEHGFIGQDEAGIAYTLLTRDRPERPLIVHCGGSTAARQDSGTLYGLKLIEFGDALLFDYPGYGDTPGKTSASSLRAMNVAVAKFVKEELASERPLILWGHSLGGFVCTDLLSRLEGIDGLVLETSVRNAKEVADIATPWFAKPFVRVVISDELAGFDNVAALSGHDLPILVLGAKEDKTLPVPLSRNLSGALKAAGHDVAYAEFEKANHISVATQPDFPEIVRDFLEHALKPAA